VTISAPELNAHKNHNGGIDGWISGVKNIIRIIVDFVFSLSRTTSREWWGRDGIHRPTVGYFLFFFVGFFWCFDTTSGGDLPTVGQ
jgi:hypothetical protein